VARTKQVLLRLTEEEYARLKELAGHEPMSSYLRRMALGEVKVTTLEPFDVEVTAENVEAVERAAAMLEDPPASAKPFKCPVPGCHITAFSDSAKCKLHDRKVIPG
jgi:hypothetical protein